MERRIRTVAELFSFLTFEERLRYLQCVESVGDWKFGSIRVLNQQFYSSKEWKEVRNTVILRDWGCDLGCSDRPIATGAIVHHIVPLLPEDFLSHSDFLLNPIYLITTCDATHRRIHYGDSPSHLLNGDRRPNDTSPWKGGSCDGGFK